MENYVIQLSKDALFIVFIVVTLYVLFITLFGWYFSRFSRDINDFFFSGQRFAWWLPAASMIATGIGSYSYLKYSEQGYNTGMSSSMTYLNDWFVMPFFMFGWLPILYFNRIKSIPEYFEKRFNRFARYLAVFIILTYMVYYIGYNFFTIGVALEGILGVPMQYSVPIVGIFLGIYVTFGGQTAVIMTDLVQGIMLYLAGALVIFAGIYALGGFAEFWSYLPITHRLPFVHLTSDPKFNTAGLFWGEALAGSIAFAFMNQGFIMRYLTIKSVHDGRKAALCNVLVSLPLSAIVVGAVGWIGKAIVTKQAVIGGPLAGYNFIDIKNTFHTFIVVCWETAKHNSWVFGFIVATLTAALMSTIDTLINACAAIGIYDIYQPLIKPKASSKHYLIAARWASGIVTTIGLLLVIVFAKQEGSLMSIHYKGIMLIIPSVVTIILMGAFWRRFNSIGASVAMVVGVAITFMTLWYPNLINPLAWFVAAAENDTYIYLRALFGMVITAFVGIVVTLFTKGQQTKDISGLTIDTLDKAMQRYKGGEPNHELGDKVRGAIIKIDDTVPLGAVSLSQNVLEKLRAKIGDVVYMADARWWLGGLRSGHVKIIASHNDGDVVKMSQPTSETAYLLPQRKLVIEKIF